MKMLEANREKAKEYRNELARLEAAKADGVKYVPIKLGSPVKDEVDKLMDKTQKLLDNTNRDITVAVNVKSLLTETDQEEKLRIAQKNKEAADLAKEARQKEREAVRAAQDTIFGILKDGQEKEVAMAKTNYARQIEDLKTKLNTEKGLTNATRAAINQQVIALETQQNIDISNINKAFSKEKFDLAMEAQSMEIETRLLRAKAGSEEEHQIKMQALAQAMEEELRANAEKEERLQIDSQLIKDKYAAQIDQAEKDRLKEQVEKERADAQLAIENKLLTAQFNNENELQAKLDAKQAEIAAIAQLDEEGDEAFLNRKLQLAIEEKNLIKDVADTKRQETQDMLSAVGGAFGALSGLMEDMAEDNEALAIFSKMLAVFEIGVNTAVAIAKGVKQAADAGPFPLNILAIATTITAVISNIAAATQLLNKTKQPKAPKMNKYATGGVVNGAGSGTSDSVPSLLSAGESVMTAMSTAMFAPILSSFNQIGGGVPIQIQNSSAQILGEDMLARAFAKGAAALPPPVLDITELTNVQDRRATIEQLRSF